MFDVIIVGSGCSGGVIAYYLTKAGKKCLLIDAGQSLSKEHFPKSELEYNSELFWNGGLDISADARFAFLRGKVLGGGSIINQALIDRFDEQVFDEWRNISKIDFFNEDSMDKHYKEIENFLKHEEIPEVDRNKNAKIFVEGFEKLGLKWAPLTRGHTDCATKEGNDCIACLGGCYRDSKQSTLVTFIAEAKRLGLEIKSDFQVDTINHGDNSADVYGYFKVKNEVKNKKDELFVKQYEKIEAKKVVLAGGSFGTTQILLKSGFEKKISALGDGFYCHPQIMNFALFDEPINSHKGMFQSVKSDDPGMKEKGFKLENVFALPIGIALLYAGYGKKHQEWMSKYKYMACIEIAIKDKSKGQIKLDKHGRLKIVKKMSKQEKEAGKEGIKIVNEIFNSFNAKEIYTSSQLFGLHLMGGCSIGTNRETSVVNDKFQLHGNENIYIADSSIFVSAPGINPSLTIMALSHRASLSIITDFNGGI